MSRTLSMFPLNLVVYPGEFLNLHIFEPRYLSLISDCMASNGTFGIPSYVQNKVEYGTEVEILDIEKKYEDGRLDIRTKGLHVFKIDQFMNPWEDRLYAGAAISYVKNDSNIDPNLQSKLAVLANEFFEAINSRPNISLSTKTSAYDIAHKIGLTKDEEYELLKIETEEKRAKFVIHHLERMIDTTERANQARNIIMMNGHFKNLDPLDF